MFEEYRFYRFYCVCCFYCFYRFYRFYRRSGLPGWSPVDSPAGLRSCGILTT